MQTIVFCSRRPPTSYARRAVERRVARRLFSDGLVLHKCATRSRWHRTLGDYFLTRAADWFVVATHQRLDELARDVGVLAANQTIVDG
jgi:hypothetical protein